MSVAREIDDEPVRAGVEYVSMFVVVCLHFNPCNS
jgi:hypothetical protein